MRNIVSEYNGIIRFGKVDYLKNGRKTCAVEVSLSLKKDSKGLFSFSAYGTVWNNS